MEITNNKLAQGETNKKKKSLYICRSEAIERFVYRALGIDGIPVYFWRNSGRPLAVGAGTNYASLVLV